MLGSNFNEREIEYHAKSFVEPECISKHGEIELLENSSIFYYAQLNRRMKEIKKEARRRWDASKINELEYELSIENALEAYYQNNEKDDVDKMTEIRRKYQPLLDLGYKQLKLKKERDQYKKATDEKWFKESIILNKNFNKKTALELQEIYIWYSNEKEKPLSLYDFKIFLKNNGVKLVGEEKILTNISKKSSLFKRRDK